MPMYQFECDGCGDTRVAELAIEDRNAYVEPHVAVVVDLDNKVSFDCGVYRRVFGFHFGRSMPAHYSHNLDSYVSNSHDYTSQLSRQQDEYSARVGYDAKFEMVDPNDAKAAGATDAGLESTERAHHDARADGHQHIFT